MKNLPQGWEWKKLGEICKVKKGNSITNAKVNPGSVPVIAGGRQPAYYHDQSNRNGNVITISASGAYAGFVNYFLEPIFASDCTTIQSLDEYKVLTRYVHLMLKCQQERIYGLQSGAGQPHVYPRDIIHIKIPLPPLPVQKQIVSILERAEKLKEKRKKANEETSKLMQSIFLEMFGEFRAYPFKIFEELIQEQKLGVVKSSSQQNPLFKYNYFKMNNITLDGNSDLSEVVKVNASEEEVKEFSLQKYDFLFNTRNTPELVGKNCVFRDNRLFLFNNNIMRIRFKNEIKPNYINFLFNTSEYKQKLNQIKTGTTSVCAIYYKNLKKIKIPIPPIELQNQFALIVEKVESLKENQQKSTEDINQLFDALMQKAFNGELAG